MIPESRSGPAVGFICSDSLFAEQCRLVVQRETDWAFAVYANLSDFRLDRTNSCALVILPSRDMLELGDREHTVRIAYGPAEDLRSSFLLACRDFLRTPFGATELVIRGEAALHRDVIETAAGTILFYSDSMRCEGKTISLRYCEYEIMRLFARAGGRLVSRNALQAAFGHPPEEESRSIDMRISRLRRKLLSLTTGASRVTIRSVRGVGYQLV